MPPGGARNAVDCALWELEARQTGQPVRRASSSHRAQSTALRAPPGGISDARASRVIPASISLRTASIAAPMLWASSLK